MTKLTRDQRLRRRLVATTAMAALMAMVGPVGVDGDGGLQFVAAAEAKCCFTGETLVTMADGRQIPIREVRPGDRVLGRDGAGDRVLGCDVRSNRVLGIERVRLAGRQLFTINDGPAFFTEEHPFLTVRGWKSVSPVQSALETPGLEVGGLAEGDHLIAAGLATATVGATALAAEFATWLVPIERLVAVPANAELEVFNLLLDGDHTYIANGFIVHNKGGEGGEGGDGGEGGEGEGSGGGEGEGSDGGEGGGDGEGSDSGEGGDSGGGESDGGEGGDSDGGEGGDSDGGDSEGGEGGDSDGGEGGSENSGRGGEGGERGNSGERGGDSAGRGRGRSGGGDDAGEGGSGGEGGFEGNADPAGPDLSAEQERDAISRGWE